MTFDEERRFKKYLSQDTHPFKNLVLIELYTGMRLGETLALNISDVDINSNTIRVSKILTHDENHKPYIHESSLSQTKDGARLVQINDVFKNNVIEAGISLPVLQTLMGHHDIQTTIDEYCKVFNFYQRKEKEKYIKYVTDGISEM